ncbi:hypothetical protein D516_0279 [Rhodobacter sp. AKP1]|nr:hypothetical protein D516_0279 [Rhodobacter sp. AKP1]
MPARLVPEGSTPTGRSLRIPASERPDLRIMTEKPRGVSIRLEANRTSSPYA